MSGYTDYEKLEITKQYLIPKICTEHGIKEKNIEISDEVILKIINGYTKESGVRELERILAKIIRKIVTKLIEKKISINKFIIDLEKVKEYLGNPIYDNTNIKESIGVVNGLAYTSYGGDVIQVEVNYFKGNGSLILTGSLGDVMKESAKIALDYIKANYKKFDIDYKIFKENDIHIHVPEGAIKKDGPSAGITITTAIISALTNKKVLSSVAMTGEITLRGNVLKIGGLKEKSIGALINKIKKIIIPKDNINDIEKLPIEVKENIEFIPVNNYYEVYDYLNKVI